jgi:GT2 family glycosyltransferase
LGFARAANLALARGKGRYFLITHPDIKLLPGAAQIMYDFLERHPRAGIVGANLLYPDGSNCSCAYRRHSLRQDLFDLVYAALRKPIKRFFWLKSNLEQLQNFFYWDHQATIETSRVWNACMMFKREVLETIGSFYEGFYIWFADTDWSYRAKNAGWQLYYLAEAKVIHYEKQSANYIDNAQVQYKVKSTLVQKALNKDRYLFLKRQHGPIFLWLRKGIDALLSFRLAWLAFFDPSQYI